MTSCGQLQRGEFFNDVIGGGGFGQAAGFLLHGGHLRGVVEEVIDFTGEDGPVVALDGDAFFQQVVGVALRPEIKQKSNTVLIHANYLRVRWL
jgi:hypothetical protein